MTDTIHVEFASTAVVDQKTRTFSGVAVTYGELTQDGRQINFAKGAFGELDSQSLPTVVLQHPFTRGAKAIRVGRVTSWTDSDAALTFEAVLNESPEGEATYQALLAGELDSVSVGVYADDFSEADGVTTFNSASLLELSIITDGKPALAGSKILSVFAETAPEAVASTIEKETHMETNLDTQVADLSGSVDDLARQFAAFADAAPVSTTTESKFESFGEVVKAVSKGDEQAIKELTEFAYTGGTTTGTVIQHKWAAPLIKVVDQRRPILSLFDKLPDPKTNTVEYLKKGVDTINVAEQAAEGDDLAYGKIALTSESTTMKTYGGWFDFSQQALDRADVNMVDLGYRALAAKYAQVTEATIRVKFLSATGTAVTGFDAASYSSVVNTVVDAQSLMDSRGENIEFIVSTPDNFKKIAKLDHSGEFILSRNSGSVDVAGIKASLFGIPIYVLASGTGVFTFTNSSALTVWESGVGRLSDSNVVNLTSAFSLYGYLGSAITNENAIVKATA